MWTLRLRGPKGAAATARIAPDATLRELCDLAAVELAIKGGKNLSLTFRSGFPPRVVAYAPDDAVQSKFANNDAIVVDTAAPGAEPRQAVAPPVAAAAAPRGRAATRGVAASVARATAQARASAKAKPKEPPARGGVHTLHGAAKPKGASATQKRKERGDGVRLGASLEEESVVVDPAPDSEQQPKYRRTRAVQLTSKDDIGVKLTEAVSGASKDRVGKFFRAATKSAVEHQYEMTLANARLKAALARQFEIQVVQNQTQRMVGTGADGEEDQGGASDIRVKFKESVRKWKEETVTLLQPLELQAALKYILISGGETGREMLKPFNMAQVSPRVFWNIARLYNGDIEAGLAALVPDEDWSYLDTRSRQMSKKAMEAKANEEVYKRWKETGTTQEDVAPAVPRRPAARRPAPSSSQEVIEIDSDGDDQGAEDQHLQDAVAYAEQAEKHSLREAMARAAAARLEVRARAQEVSAAIRERESASAQPAETRDPEETESDEEQEDDGDVEKTTTVYCDACGKARIVSLAEAATLGLSDGADDQDAEWTCAKLAVVGRENATCDAIDDEVEQIAGAKLAQLLQSQADIRTRQQLANASLATALRGLSHPLDPNYADIKAKLDEIINEARLDEVNDAMAEIVGDNGDLVGLLELQKLGTPADLVETPTDLVVAAVASRKKQVSAEDVLRWQQDARQRIGRFSWMGEWRTI